MAEPKVRFKRDDGSSYPDLVDKKLGDIGTVLMCKRVFREQTDSTGDVPFYKIGTFGGVPDAFISRELYEELKTKYSFPKKGNVLLSAAGTIGRTVRYDGEDAFFQDSNIVWLDHDDSVLDDYLYYFYQQASWKNLEGGTIQRLYNGILLDKDISIPSLEEQQKIADFLSSVDDVISTSEQEVANLETQKKAVMKKIFSQEVRFKKADGTDFPEWEEKTLGELAVFSKGQGYTKSDLSETGSPIILYGRLYTKYQTVISEVDTFAEMKPRSVLSKKGDVIVPASGETAEDISVAAVVDADGIILGGDINIIHPCDAVLPNYLAYSLTFGTPHQEMAKRAQGKSIVHLHNDDLKAAVIIYPCLEEQRLIADFLSDFDEAIAAAKKELELWKKLKKGLLQQMFV